jgi:osmotically-inducible protein OsmY
MRQIKVQSFLMKKKFSCLFFACIAPFLLSGCPAAVVLSGASGAAVINDERSTGSFVEDYAIELKMRVQLSSDIDSNVNISITSYNRRLLLTGQAPTEALRQQVIDIAENIENVREILNQIEIAGAASLSSQASDSALTARVKAALCSIQIEDFFLFGCQSRQRKRRCLSTWVSEQKTSGHCY